MNNKEIIEIMDAVNSIESDIYESTDGVEYFNITVKTNGFVMLVEFLGIQIWNSDDDMRKENKNDGSYEPIEPYLRRVIKEEIKKINTVAL